MKVRNVILLTIDTLRQDEIGIYGNSALTPYLDSLAEKCIIFKNAQAIGPYTQVSFPGILTSSYYFDYGRSTHLSPQKVLISEPLRKAGIVTAAIHSNPYISGFFGWNREWDFFYDSMQDEVSDKVPYTEGEVINKKVDGWLSSHIKDKDYRPFFLWVHYMDIHEPYIPKRKYADMVHPSVNLTEDEMFQLFKETLLKRDVSNKDKIDILRKLYEIKIRETDDHVKHFFEILEKFDILKDSVIIITSDHGDEFNEHGGLSHDGKMFQELLKVPLLIFDPSIEKQKVSKTFVSNIDIPPTIIHLFGLGAVKSFQGQSLIPLADYKEKGCFGEAIEKSGHRIKETDKEAYYYIENNLKIIYRGNSNKWEMYNLQDDPMELHNIIETSSEVEGMKRILKPRIERWKK